MNTPGKRVLYISYDGMTDPLGQSQVIPYLAGLCSKGYCITILSCEKKDNFLRYKSNIQAILNAANIKWEPLLYTKTPPILSTLYDYYQILKKARALNAYNNFDIIHCRSYIAALIGQYMKRRHNVPFIFDMRGFWADERVDGGLWNLKNPVFKYIYQYFKKKELEFLNQSAAIICLTHAGKKEILTWKHLTVNADKIKVIPCCVDTKLFDAEKITVSQKQNLRRKLGIEENAFILGYLGSIGTWYMLDEMLQYFAQLKRVIAHAKLVMVTADDPAYINQKANENQIDTNDIIITKAARNEVPLHISLFNYGLFFIKPSYSKMASSPTKQGEIMAMGIPIICNSGVGDTDNIINNYEAGLVVKDFDYNSSISALSSFTAFNSQKIRQGALDFFSLQNGVNKYHEVYSEINKRNE